MTAIFESSLPMDDLERPFLLLVVGYPADGARVPDITRRAVSQVASFVE